VLAAGDGERDVEEGTRLLRLFTSFVAPPELVRRPLERRTKLLDLRVRLAFEDEEGATQDDRRTLLLHGRRVALPAKTLKTLSPFFEEIVAERKTFEIRRDDRDYDVGDVLLLRDYDGTRYTDRAVLRFVPYVLREPRFVLPDHVVLSIVRRRWLPAGGGEIRLREDE
jgi:hypothetical protein